MGATQNTWATNTGAAGSALPAGGAAAGTPQQGTSGGTAGATPGSTTQQGPGGTPSAAPPTGKLHQKGFVLCEVGSQACYM